MIQYKEFEQCKQLIGLPKIDKLGQVYNLSVRVKVDVVTDEIGVMSIGLDRYVPRYDQSTNNCTTEKHISCNRNNNNVNMPRDGNLSQANPSHLLSCPRSKTPAGRNLDIEYVTFLADIRYTRIGYILPVVLFVLWPERS